MDEIITFETAKLAKALGFNIPTQDRYRKDGGLNQDLQRRFGGVSNWNHECFQDEYRQYTSAPTQSSLQKWLREEHNIEININQNITVHVEYYYFVSIVTLAPNKLSLEERDLEPFYYSYEEALEAGLWEALKLI